MGAWRQLRAIGPLPGVGAIVIPTLIVWLTGDVLVGWGLPLPLGALTIALGTVLMAAGLLLMQRTILLLDDVGHGTLAPWDPTRELVVEGPYRYVRNPMITGVLLILAGEAALLGSPWIIAWAAAFLAVNAVWFPLVEEPGLERRFGDAYAEYRRSVPRWLPRRTPWRPWTSGDR